MRRSSRTRRGSKPTPDSSRSSNPEMLQPSDPVRIDPEQTSSPDVARQGILVDLLSLLVQLREPEEVWTEAVHKMKWLLEFDRVDLALFDASETTYSLKTLFESRPGVPLF